MDEFDYVSAQIFLRPKKILNLKGKSQINHLLKLADCRQQKMSEKHYINKWSKVCTDT